MLEIVLELVILQDHPDAMDVRRMQAAAGHLPCTGFYQSLLDALRDGHAAPCLVCHPGNVLFNIADLKKQWCPRGLHYCKSHLSSIVHTK